MLPGFLLILFLVMPAIGTFFFPGMCCGCGMCLTQRIGCMGCGMNCGGWGMGMGMGCGMGMMGWGGGYGMGYGAPFGLGGYNDFYALEAQSELLGGMPGIDAYAALGGLGYGGYGYGYGMMGYGGFSPFGYMGYKDRRRKEENPETLIPFS